LLSSEGKVYDAFPGVYIPQDYLSELRKTMDQIKNNSDILSWHKQELAASVKTEETRMTMSKAVVESPLLKALGKGRYSKQQAKDSATAFNDYTAKLQDVSKEGASIDDIRSRILTSLRTNDPNEVGRAAVQLDSQNNLKLIRPAVHLLFLSYNNLPTIEQCRDRIYQNILHVPIHDPYLGLADAIVPGSPVQ
jgi:hypothetical protein